MATVRIPLVGSPTNRSANLNKDQRFVNCFPETVANNITQSQQVYLVKRDGMLRNYQPSGATGEGRGLYSWNGKLWTVIGNKLWTDISKSGTWTTPGASTTITVTSNSHGYLNGDWVTIIFDDDNLNDGEYQVTNQSANTFDVVHATTLASASGSCVINRQEVVQTLSTSSGAVGFTEFSAANDFLVLIDTTDGYYISTTDVVTKITDPEFPTPHLPYGVFMDGCLYIQKVTGEIFNCDVGEVDKWSASSYIQPESYPDGAVCLARQNNLIAALGVNSVEFFYNAANPTPGSPLGRNLQAIIQFGCASGASVAQEEGVLLFVAASKTGEKFVVAVEGTKDTTISTEAINRVLAAEGSNIVDSWAYLTRQKGHLMYVLNLPSQSRTLVFDMQTKMWHEWEWFDDTTDGVFPMVMATEYQDQAWLLHQANGWVYTADPLVYSDDYEMKVMVQTSRFDGETAKVKFMDRLEVIGDFQEEESDLYIYWSDDDYKTWSAYRSVDLQQRAYIYRCGSFRRRALKFYHYADTPLRLNAIECEVRGGTH